MTLDRAGNIYASDNRTGRVLKFDKNGSFLTWFQGTSNPRFADALGALACDASGNIYVADRFNNCIRIFNDTGVYQGLIGSGSGSNAIVDPSGVAVDSKGNVFVGDDRGVRKFNAQGQRLLVFPGWFKFDPTVAVDSVGAVYVSDFGQVQKFTNEGVFLLAFGSYGNPYSDLQYPSGIAIDASGTVYVADSFARQIVVFAPDLARVDLLRTPVPTVTRDGKTGDLLVTVTVTNSGTATATGGKIVGARLNQIVTKTSLPVRLPNIVVSGSASVVLRFPGKAATSGTRPFITVDFSLGDTRTTASVRTATVP